MNKLLVAAAVASLTSFHAQAADVAAPTYTKAPPVQVSSWTGFYAGLNVGYGFNDPTATLTPNDTLIAAVSPAGVPPISYDVKGILGGAQVGYNWQVSPNWLIGIEADFQGSDIKGAGSSSFIVGSNPFVAVARQNVDWFGTVRGRLGLLASDKLLVYGTGGLAYGSVNTSATTAEAINGNGNSASSGAFGFACNTNIAFNPCFAGTEKKILVGYSAGAGLEYAVWQNVTFKLEYLYVNLGSTDVRSVAINANGAAQPSSYNAHFTDLDFHVARVGINYRF